MRTLFIVCAVTEHLLETCLQKQINKNQQISLIMGNESDKMTECPGFFLSAFMYAISGCRLVSRWSVIFCI